jgi:hypothetical protein
MKKEFTWLWAFLGLYVVAVELMAPSDFSRILAFGFFALVEIWALGRPGSGDTLSEHVWAFYAGKPARVPLIIGFVLYAGVALVNIPAETDLMVGVIPLAPLCLVLGLVGWLVPHFLSRGELG